jgi:tellurite resistance protein
MFKNMGDTEILSCIQENKAQYLADPAEKQQLLDDVHSIIAADGRHSAMENQLIRELKRVLG